MRYVNQKHRDRYRKLITIDHTDEEDLERKSLFYLLSSCEELWTSVYQIYDFEERSLYADAETRIPVSGAVLRMLELGRKLFSGHCKDYNDVKHLFSNLDIENFEVCMYAVRIFFGNVTDDSEAEGF